LKLDTIIPALVGLVGVAIGAWAAYASSHHLRLEEDLSEYRYKAYRDFIESQFVDYSAQGDPEKLDTKEERLWDAHRRMAIFSSEQVVRSVFAFSRQIRPNLEYCTNLQDKRIDLQMWQAIRSEVHKGQEQVEDETLAVMIFPDCKFVIK